MQLEELKAYVEEHTAALEADIKAHFDEFVTFVTTKEAEKPPAPEASATPTPTPRPLVTRDPD